METAVSSELCIPDQILAKVEHMVQEHHEATMCFILGVGKAAADKRVVLKDVAERVRRNRSWVSDCRRVYLAYADNPLRLDELIGLTLKHAALLSRMKCFSDLEQIEGDLKAMLDDGANLPHVGDLRKTVVGRFGADALG